MAKPVTRKRCPECNAAIPASREVCHLCESLSKELESTTAQILAMANHLKETTQCAQENVATSPSTRRP